MVDVVLVNPPCSFLEVHTSRKSNMGSFFNYPPLGLLYLASSIRKSGFSVEVIDAPTENLSEWDVVRKLLRWDIKLVGISMTTPQARSGVSLAKTLKLLYPERPICAGGPHLNIDENFLERYPQFCFTVLGEAEETFPNIVKRVIQGECFCKKTFKGSVEDLDSLPFPARDLVDSDHYHTPIFKEKFISILGSRGCPFSCSFCSRPAISRIMRYRSPKNIYDEIVECKAKYKTRNFQFVDDLFGINRAWTFELMCLLKPLDIKFGLLTRVKLVDESFAKAVAESGCVGISLGIESGDEKIRTRNGKPFTDEEAKNAVRLLQNYGIKVNCFYIIGLIGDDKESIRKTIEHPFYIGCDFIEPALIIPYPGTEIFDVGLKQGSFDADVWNRFIEGKISEQPIYIPPTLSKEYMLDAQAKMYHKFYFRPKYILRRLASDISSFTKVKEDFRIAVTLKNIKRQSK